MAIIVDLNIGVVLSLNKKLLTTKPEAFLIISSGTKSGVRSFIIPLDKIKLLSPSGVTKQNALPIAPTQGFKKLKSTLDEVVQIYLKA